jgi:hypothetical protein
LGVGVDIGIGRALEPVVSMIQNIEGIDPPQGDKAQRRHSVKGIGLANRAHWVHA